MRRLLRFALVIAFAACGDETGLIQGTPTLFAPSQVDFGTVNVGTPNVVGVELRNDGSVPLEVFSVEVVEGTDYYKKQSSPDRIDASPVAQLALVEFTPPAPGDFTGKLLVKCNDPNQPEATVALVGKGGIAKIDLPVEIAFGTVDEGSPQGAQITIKNVGQAALPIREILLSDTATDQFSLSAPADVFFLAPDATTDVTVTYSARVVGAAAADLVVLSDDNERPEVRVALTALSNLRPRMKVVEETSNSDEANVKLNAVVTLDGSASTDPEGQPLIFTWAMVEKPQGSNADVEHTDVAVNHFKAGSPGTYRVVVTARDERNLSSLPAEVVIHSVRDFTLVLTWDISNDLDLHFVDDGGTVGDYNCSGVPRVCNGSDCSFANRHPDWGPAGDAGNPTLDIDSTSRGPESISIDAPDPGVYRVFVAYYGRVSGSNPPANATVAFYHRNDLVHTFGPMTLGQRCALWEVAQITLPAATWQVVDSLDTNTDLCK